VSLWLPSLLAEKNGTAPTVTNEIPHQCMYGFFTLMPWNLLSNVFLPHGLDLLHAKMRDVIGFSVESCGQMQNGGSPTRGAM
jgi:hypothetical protein